MLIFNQSINMKTLMIATDFSVNAQHAAAYGYYLAQQLKARILIFHVMNVPAEIPQNGFVAWPMSIYDDLIQDSNNAMDQLKRQLIANSDPKAYQPEIICIHEPGLVTDVVNAQAVQNQADLIIISEHGNDTLGTLMIGNHSRKLIDATVTPLLLIPFSTNPKPIKKIAVGSDFKQPDLDMQVINKLVGFAKAFGSELILTHIDQSNGDTHYNTVTKHLITELISKIDYPQISYKMVKSAHVENGLNWLIRHLHVDMLAMVHREHNFFDQLINGSHTQKAAHLINVPLLVFKHQNNK